MLIKKYFMKSLKRITKDFKQKELLPLKLVFFVQATTISVLYPYLTIHMRELGINVEEAAIMSAVIPVIGIIMPPLAGMVADKIGNFKLLLAFFSLIGGVVSLLLLLVPVGRVTVTYPEKITLDFGCRGSEEGLGGAKWEHFQLGLSPEIPCQPVPGLNDSKGLELVSSLEACGFICRSADETSELQQGFPSEENAESTADPILKGRSYVIRIETEAGTRSLQYNLTKDDVPKTQTKEDALSERIMANDDHLKKSLRKVARSKYFLPASELSHLSCKKVSGENGGEKVHVACAIGAQEGEDEIFPNENGTITFRLRKETKGDKMSGFWTEFMKWASNESLPVACVRSDLKGDISASVYFHDPENNLEILETFPLSNCEPRCLLSSTRKTLCTNLKKEVLYDPQLTFWIYLVIRVFIGIIGSTSYAMYEVAVIAILREQKADYGLQRIYASIGGMISSPLSGILIDYASRGKSYTDFRPAFYLYAGLKIATSILMLFINLEFKQAASNVVKDAIMVLKNLEIIALLAACFVLGSAWGYIESFLFWFLEDLGGTRSLMGITITVGGIAGIPLLILSGPIIDKIGHANVLFIGFLFYAIRLVGEQDILCLIFPTTVYFLATSTVYLFPVLVYSQLLRQGYSVIYNPYHCLFFEAMESITSSLAITAAITYAAKLSTTTTDGSIQGLVGGFYFGVGRGAGSLIGGYLMKALGTRETFRIFAVFSVLTGVMYYLFNQFYIRKRPQREGNDICKKEPKPDKNLESNLQIITEKPKIETENNNTPNNTPTGKEGEQVVNQIHVAVEEEKKAEKKIKNEDTGSHNYPGFVSDEDTKTIGEQEMKKKED